MVTKLVVSLLVLIMACACSGCMQLTGMQKAKFGTWEFTSNAGFDVSAGVMQYDNAKNLKGKSHPAE